MSTQHAQKPSRFLLESSPSSIYQRITAGYRDALQKHGHSTTYFNPGQYGSFDEALQQYLAILNTEKIDYFLIFDNSPLSNFYLKESDCFIFEKSDAFIIFIHHDNLWSSFATSELETGRNPLEGWHRVRDRSAHFCLEYGNFIDLRSMGFDRVYPIFHGSEFEKLTVPNASYQHDVAFVGHVLPNIRYGFERCEPLPFSHLIAADFWARLASLDKSIAPSAIAFASQDTIFGSPEFIRKRSLYQFTVSLLSTCFRGELIKRLNPQFQVSIIGGDPGYISGSPANRHIEQENVAYYPSTDSAMATRDAYAKSKINLNITGIQFDDAIVNRVVDVGSVGGFILTDKRNDLSKITSVNEEISYRTIEELNHKIDYYLSHEKERLEVADQLHQDVIRRCRYSGLIEFILSKLSPMERNDLDLVQVDLGCGIHKPKGFIGVDVFPAPNVDIVADLNRQFPFPDSSVDYVRAYDTIEHLPDRIHTMNEIWRICKPGALVDLRVPSTDGRGAFQDPTHVSFWNINSFKYYSVEFPPYLDLCKRYGFQGEFSIVELGHEEKTSDEVVHVRALLKAMKSQDLLINELAERLHLQSINLMVFPDWTQLGEDLSRTLVDVLKVASSHPERHQFTLLIDKGNFSPNSDLSLEELLYELVLNLLLNDGIDIANDGPEIALVENLSMWEYGILLQHVSGRIPIPQENLDPLSAHGIENMPVYDLEILRSVKYGY